MAQLLFFLVTAIEERVAESRQSILSAKLKAWRQDFSYFAIFTIYGFWSQKLPFSLIFSAVSGEK